MPKWSPQRSIRTESERRGRAAFVAGCIDLLSGKAGDPELIVALGGAPARWAVDGGAPGPPYWLRVWAARGLLWEWDDDALPAVRRALKDDAWRVREAALKVVARHRLEKALSGVNRLRTDPNARVRNAAERAAKRIARDS